MVEEESPLHAALSPYQVNQRLPLSYLFWHKTIALFYWMCQLATIEMWHGINFDFHVPSNSNI